MAERWMHVPASGRRLPLHDEQSSFTVSEPIVAYWRHAETEYVTHGEKDDRVPVAHGFECYSVLQAKGVPARLVHFLDENPWILKPHNSIRWHREVFDRLERRHTGTAESAA